MHNQGFYIAKDIIEWNYPNPELLWPKLGEEYTNEFDMMPKCWQNDNSEENALYRKFIESNWWLQCES